MVTSEITKGGATPPQAPRFNPTDPKIQTGGNPLGPKILVIDDEPGVRASMYFTLKDQCQLTLASNAADGWKAFQEGQFDIVFCDIGMAGGAADQSGFPLFKKMQQHRPNQELVVFSGFVRALSDEDKAKFRIPDDHFLDKPPNVADVRALVQRFASKPKELS
jgi:DNA-binding NtrC family response regulator